jgi:hypothetical protein
LSRSAIVAVLALSACPGLPDETDTNGSTDIGPGTTDTADTAPLCPEDLLEENDSVDAAIRPEILPISAQVCAGDEDWFEIDATPGCVTVVDLAFANDQGDLDLEIYNGEDRIAVSSSTTDDESTRFFVEEATTVQARVVGFFGAENAYSLSTSAECAPCEFPDAFEDNDTRETAASAAFPVMADGCVDDPDWYAAPTTLLDGCVLDITLQPLDVGVSDVSLTLVDSTGGTVATGTPGAVGLGLRTLGAPTDVIGVVASTTLVYDLSTRVSCPPLPPLDCTTDNNDMWQNNVASTAIQLRDGVSVRGSICGVAGSDWWSVPVRSECTTVVTVTSSSTDGTAIGTPVTDGLDGTPTTADGTVAVSTVTGFGDNQVRIDAQDLTSLYDIRADILCAEPAE